jgi:hypothetical protein
MKLEKEGYPAHVWRVLELVEGRRQPEDVTELHFLQYFADNQDIWRAFRAYAAEMQNAGRAVGSAWLIVNRIRWDYYLEAVDDNADFKISNEYIALFARLYMEIKNCPHFFRTKLRKVERRRLKEAGFNE